MPSETATDPRHVSERCPVALLPIDIINDMDFEGSDALVKTDVRPAAELDLESLVHPVR